METKEKTFIEAVESLINLRESLAYNDLSSLIEEKMKNKTDTSRSIELNELFSALAKAQADMLTASMASTNPYFKTKYADLEEIVKASRPALTKNGLAVLQQIMIHENGESMLHTILAHSSGQFIESRMRILPPKNDIQTLGSYITYLRRYSYASLVCVIQGEDDDGEIAMVEARQIIAKGPSNKYNPKEESTQAVTREQLEELEYELEGLPDLAEEILYRMELQSLADLPKSKYMSCVQRIREIKNTRSGIK